MSSASEKEEVKDASGPQVESEEVLLSEGSFEKDESGDDEGNLFDVPDQPLTIQKPQKVEEELSESDTPKKKVRQPKETLKPPTSMLVKRNRNEVQEQEQEDDYNESENSDAGSQGDNEASANIRRQKGKNRSLGATLETGFLQERRKRIYENLNEVEKQRYSAQLEGKIDQTKMKVFIQSLPGPKIKGPSLIVTQAIISSAKTHAGQLIELAKLIQIEELKLKCAEDFPLTNSEPQIDQGENPSRYVAPSGHYMSDRALAEFNNKMKHLGPCLPHHMREARSRMIQTKTFVHEKPKCMFKRKNF